MQDPITDMLNRIRNAQAVEKAFVQIPFSRLKEQMADILYREQFISKVEKKGRIPKKFLEITLVYTEGKNGQKLPRISGLKRISKPSQKMYLKTKNLKRVRDGYGVAILSTSQGLITNREAWKKKIGGEILCEVW